MDLLLDTCAFLWLALDPEKIPAKAAGLLNDTSNRRMFSMVSVLEIVLTDPVIFQSRHLPGNHSDPFDRLIAAQARIMDCPVLTSDPQIGRLGAKVLWG